MKFGSREADSLVLSSRYYAVFFLVVPFFATVFFLALLEDFLGVDLAVPLVAISFETLSVKSSAGSRERFFPFMGYSKFSAAKEAHKNAGVFTLLPLKSG